MRRLIIAVALVTGLAVVPTAAAAEGDAFASPLFGLATAPDGAILVADAGAGVVEMRHGETELVAALPGVTDIAPVGRRSMWAITGLAPDPAIPGQQTLYRVKGSKVTPVADLGSFEAAVNPDGAEIDSNPFDVEALPGGRVLVADAGANALLIVERGRVDWVATLPDELVSTADVKELVGCGGEPISAFADLCLLPPELPAEGVATSVAVGPDGAYYVAELKGFPAPRGESRIWRIEPGARHAQCGVSPACSVVADGFTSIVDLEVGRDGTFYVTELDEASWAAVEFGLATEGGTVNACDPSTWNCRVAAADLPMPIATTVGKDGTVYAAIFSLVPGLAAVVPIG